MSSIAYSFPKDNKRIFLFFLIYSSLESVIEQTALRGGSPGPSGYDQSKYKVVKEKNPEWK